MPVTGAPRWEPYLQHYAAKVFPVKLNQYPWNYKHDLCLQGLDALYAATGQESYLAAALSARSFLMDEHGHIRNFPAGEHNLDKISFGKSLLLLFNHTRDEQYAKAAERCFARLQAHPRTQSGGFFHKDIYPYQIWLDGLYMALPFCADCEIRNGTEQFDDILRQFAAVRARLFMPDTGLYLHAWDESRKAAWADPQTGVSPTHWLRAEGWLLMALCDCYERLQGRTPGAALLAQLLDEALFYLLPYRDAASGMYLQVPDRADAAGNYFETSGSAMIAYAMLKGARLRMIDPSYAQTGKALLDAIQQYSLRSENGETRLHAICASAGLGPGPHNRPDRDGTVRYYLSETQSPDNQHGAGACMLAYAEAVRAGG